MCPHAGMERFRLKSMSRVKIELDHDAMRAWLQGPDMQGMLESVAREAFDNDDYEVKVLSSRAIVTSKSGNDKDLLRGVKGGKKK